MLSDSIVRRYKERRKPHWIKPNEHFRGDVFTSPARLALLNARIDERWSELESDGLVRLEWRPDESCDMRDLEGDCYDPKVNTDIRPALLERQRKEFHALVEREGVWGCVGQYRLSHDAPWIDADSVWGLVGTDDTDCGGDVQYQTLDAFDKARADAEPCYECQGLGWFLHDPCGIEESLRVDACTVCNKLSTPEAYAHAACVGIDCYSGGRVRSICNRREWKAPEWNAELDTVGGAPAHAD